MKYSQNRRQFLKAMGFGATSLAMHGCISTSQRISGGTSGLRADTKPNFIIILTDDQGYNDLGCFGSPLIKTSRLDRMAQEGMKFTSFYTQPICGPSRAALMTGCYPMRVAEVDNKKFPHPRLHPKEITLAEVLKEAGYATAHIGKWHLTGDWEYLSKTRKLMPTRQGFDYYYGIPYSNDWQPGVLMLNEEVIENPANQATLTERYTDEAIGFIARNKDHPFFLYLAHTMPHTPLHISKRFEGKSARGLYGDVIECIDYSCGEILDTLKKLGLDNNTYVIFASDNGPWLVRGEHGGCALPLRAGKMTTFEGGVRVPCIMWAPGRIPAGKACDEITTLMDMMPTFVKLAGAKLPADRVIDGRDIQPLMMGQAGVKGPTEVLYYYLLTHLQAVRCGKWKLLLPRPARAPWLGSFGRKSDWKLKDDEAVPKLQLYNLEKDIGEKYDVADKYPDVVAQLVKLAEKAREDLGDYNRIGKGARFFDKGPPRPEINEWKKEVNAS